MDITKSGTLPWAPDQGTFMSHPDLAATLFSPGENITDEIHGNKPRNERTVYAFSHEGTSSFKFEDLPMDRRNLGPFTNGIPNRSRRGQMRRKVCNGYTGQIQTKPKDIENPKRQRERVHRRGQSRPTNTIRHIHGNGNAGGNRTRPYS